MRKNNNTVIIDNDKFGRYINRFFIFISFYRKLKFHIELLIHKKHKNNFIILSANDMIILFIASVLNHISYNDKKAGKLIRSNHSP